MAEAGETRNAVIGMACRFPGGLHSPEDYWRCLESGRIVIDQPPATRWDLARYYTPALAELGAGLIRGGYLERVDTFDADFFGVDAREAKALDPQQRILLEVTWEALLSAGIEPRSLRGRAAGVFVAVGNSDYDRLACRDLRSLSAYSGIGTQYCTVPGRISYSLDLRGPSLAIDTGCSSSLVALHLARQSLARGEIDLAIVGATNVIIAPEKTVALAKAGLLSPSGRCRAFDQDADGYVRGEGCAALILERDQDALAHGNRTLGYVRGSAVNHDGTSNGFAAPRGPTQQQVIEHALRSAGVSAEEVTLLESHGTGTALGDMIEIRAASAVYRRADRAAPCALGALKANIGHLEPAAGMASLIKVLLCGQHGSIAPTVDCAQPNPRLQLERGPFFIPRTHVPWQAVERGRFAAISCFSFCGTNAHVIVEGRRASSATTARTRHAFAQTSHWFEPAH